MIREELRYLLKKHNMSYAELAEKADVPLETTRNLYYGRVENPKVSTLLAISNVFGVSINRLLGERLYSGDEEILMKAYRECGDHGKSIIMFTAEYALNLAMSERNSPDKFTIPCIIPTESFHDGLEYNITTRVDVTTNNPEPYVAMEITSNVFAPTYCKGDRVLIANRFPENGEIAIFIVDNHMYFRLLQEKEDGYLLKCINGRGETFKIKRPDEVLYMGTCVGVIRS